MAKLAFFATAWVHGLASRTEGSSMLQINEHVQVDANRMEYLNNVKQQILSLAANGVPAETIKVLDSVSAMLTDQVLTAIDGERTLEQENHDTVFADFANASDVYTSALNAATAFLNGAVTTTKAAHSDCRGPGAGSESEAHSDSVACNGRQDVAQDEYDTDEGSVDGLSQIDGVCVEADYSWRTSGTLAAYRRAAQEYATAIGKVISSRAALEANITECNGLTNVHNDKTAECNTTQRTFETNACTYTGMVTGAVTAYTTRYGQVKQLFEGFWAGYDASSENREAQCKLVKTLVCYIAGLKANDDSAPLTAAVATCDTQITPDTDECAYVTFAHAATPAAVATADTPLSPCDPDFHYVDTWPAGTAQATCHTCP